MPDPVFRPALGAALKRWRLLHRVKQMHAAEMFGVAQSTISRWESGRQQMDAAECARVERVLLANLSSAADSALARLITGSTRPVHLICDLSHRLLACSPSRAAQFSAPVAALMGASLWPFATDEIRHRESTLGDLGWRHMRDPGSLEFANGANNSTLVPIQPGICRWTRFTLSDGTAARLVESL